MLIDQSYFVGPLTIAQLGQPSVVEDLNNFINKWEPVIMEAALGYDFYQAFLAGLDVDSDDVIEQRWLDLLNGVAFNNVSGRKVRWVGFLSPLAGFIYFEYMKDLASQNTGIGVVKNQGEHSFPVSPAQKMVDAYNDACRQMYVLAELLRVDQNKAVADRTYPEFLSNQVGSYYNVFEYNGFWYGMETYDFRPINTFGI